MKGKSNMQYKLFDKVKVSDPFIAGLVGIVVGVHADKERYNYMYDVLFKDKETEHKHVVTNIDEREIERYSQPPKKAYIPKAIKLEMERKQRNTL